MHSTQGPLNFSAADHAFAGHYETFPESYASESNAKLHYSCLVTGSQCWHTATVAEHTLR